MVGKTRMAARVVGELFPERVIFIPDGKKAIAELDAADIVLKDAVIWLDDLDRLIGSDGISAGMLRRLAAAENIIVATVRATEYDAYKPTDQLKRPEWDVILEFERIIVEPTLSELEERRLADAVPDGPTRDRIRQVGVGEYVGAAEQIVDQLRVGPSVNPVGYALVCGAADWRRAGMTRPVPTPLLAELAKPHARTPRVLTGIAQPDTFSAGLVWATRTINPTVALLELAGDGYEVFDFALDQLAERSDPIEAETWHLVMEQATPKELLSIGYAAYLAGSSAVALISWRKAEESNDPAAGPTGAAVLETAKAVTLDTELRSSGRSDVRASYMSIPPLTDSTLPVMKPASSSARNRTARAISCAWPSRPTGIRATILSSASCGTAATISVST